MIPVNLDVNNEYSKEEIENIFNTKFGFNIKGITLRIWDDSIPYIILFSKERGPYNDREDGNIDQKLTTANKTLLNSNESGRIIFGFRQYVNSNKWLYIGELKLVDYEYINKNGYMTYQFKLKIKN